MRQLNGLCRHLVAATLEARFTLIRRGFKMGSSDGLNRCLQNAPPRSIAK